jgi:hypothetical protein
MEVLGREIWKVLEPTAEGFYIGEVLDLGAELVKREVHFIFNDVVFQSKW